MNTPEAFPFPSLPEDDPEVDRLLLSVIGNWIGTTRLYEDQRMDTLRLFGDAVIDEYPEGYVIS